MSPVEPGPGWQPLRRPNTAVAVSPFGRLARVQAASIAGDTMVTLALADSIFFGISPSESRGKVLLYLLLTMAPFAVIAPLLGPWIDASPGGRRLMILVSTVGRAVVGVLLIDDIGGLLLFPEAFAVLVLAKSYQVARSALVPTLVRDHAALVEANSKLSLVSGVVGFAAGLPGVLVLHLLGAQWVLGFGVVLFGLSTVLAVRLPRLAIAGRPADPQERAELRGAGVLLAASAMGLLRGIVGFMTFLVAFFLRTDGAPAWWFGVVIAVSAGGAMAGAALSPVLRRRAREEWILAGALVEVAGLGALMAVGSGGRGSTALLAAGVAVAASTGKTAFDSIVQRDAPDANQGRSFARFETRFQLVWVIGALIPVIISLPVRVGFTLVALTAGFAAGTYVVGLRAAAAHHRPRR